MFSTTVDVSSVQLSALQRLAGAQTVEPLRKSPPRTSPATPLRITLRKGSTSKVAGFYSATRDRVMPPLRGLLLLRRVHTLIADQNLAGPLDVHEIRFALRE